MESLLENSGDTDNLNLSCSENDISDELKIAADETYDTRSEVSSSSSDSDSSQPSISTVSTKSSRGDNKRSRGRSRNKRTRSRDSESPSPEAKRARSRDSKSTTKNYDFNTKLNYLFRDTRFDMIIINDLIFSEKSCSKMKFSISFNKGNYFLQLIYKLSINGLCFQIFHYQVK